MEKRDKETIDMIQRHSITVSNRIDVTPSSKLLEIGQWFFWGKIRTGRMSTILGEQRYFGFYEHIPLPDDTDKDAIDATYREGVLELRVPKKETTKRLKVKIK